MKIKRLLATVLALSMMLSIMPVITFADTLPNPEYSPGKMPELTLFNANTAKSTKFYESVLNDGRYSAVAAGYFKNGDKTLTYDKKVDSNSTWTWAGFCDTQIAYMYDQADDIMINHSVTLHTNIHEHKWWTGPFTQVKATTYGRMDTSLYFTAAYSSTGQSYLTGYLGSIKTENKREGDREFVDLPSFINGDHIGYYTSEDTAGKVNTDLNLKVSKVYWSYDGGDKTCKCGGNVTGNFISFYDGDAPFVSYIRTLDEDGNEAVSFKPGDTVKIELHCNEPIRFADNSNAGKNNIWLALLPEGRSDYEYARLVKVENNGGLNYYDSSLTYHRDRR